MTRSDRSDRPRTLGSDGPVVSPIGLGLAALGRPGYINLGRDADLGDQRSEAAMEARARAVLDEAWRAGVRYFDAARSYGRAEAFLGRWLAANDIGPDEVVVGSKWGYAYTAQWRVDADVHEVKELSLRQLRTQWEETRERLGGHLDLYQVHSLTLASGALDDRPLLDALAALKGEGVRVGLTTSGPEQAEVIARATELRIEGLRVFDTVQSTWNVLERSAAAALREAHEAGLGVIVKEALANGRLAGRSDAPRDAGAELAAQAERLGTSVDALALAAALAQPWADVVLSGAVTAAQLRANLGAREVALDAPAWDALDGLIEAPDAYWARRSDLPWR